MIVIGQYTFPYFTMFYIIAFLTCFVVLIVEGRMRNFPVLAMASGDRDGIHILCLWLQDLCVFN